MKSKIRLMVVDDSKEFLTAACRFLTRHGNIEVVAACSSAHEALIAASVLNPEAVLIDLRMPEKSGFSGMTELKALLPDIILVAMSFDDSGMIRAVAKGSGANAFVGKGNFGEAIPALLTLVQARRKKIFILK